MHCMCVFSSTQFYITHIQVIITTVKIQADTNLPHATLLWMIHFFMGGQSIAVSHQVMSSSL